jgi:hypothetical protein
VRNAYTVKLLNKSSTAHSFVLSISGVDARMAIIGNDGLAPIRIAPDASEALRVTLTATASTQGDVVFTARDETGMTVLSAKDRFVER